MYGRTGPRASLGKSGRVVGKWKDGRLGVIRGTLYCLAGGPIYRGGRTVVGKRIAEKGESKGEEYLHS